MSLCIYQSSENIEYAKSIIFRDIGFYILTTCTTIFFGWIGKLEMYSAIIMLSIYVALVVVVVVQDKLEEKEEDASSSNVANKSIEMGSKPDIVVNSVTSNEKDEFKANLLPPNKPTSDMNSNVDSIEDAKPNPFKTFSKAETFLAVTKQVVRIYKDPFIANKIKMEHRKCSRSEFSQCKEDERDCEYWIWTIIYFPMNAVMYFVGLSPSKENYTKTQTLVWCIFGPMYIIDGMFQDFFPDFP